MSFVRRTSSLWALLGWLFNRPLEPTIDWVETKFAKKPAVVAANIAALQSGLELRRSPPRPPRPLSRCEPAVLRPGTYTNVTGNTALAWGLIAAAQCAKLPLFYGTYPITPASDILHELSMHKNFGVRTFQAEDEIAAIGVGHRCRLRRQPRCHRNLRARGGAEE